MSDPIQPADPHPSMARSSTALLFGRFAACLFLAAVPLFALKAAMPFAWNYFDSAVILIWSEQRIGHFPFLYMKLISHLKSHLGIGWTIIEQLTRLQFALFAICLAVFLMALESWKGRMVALVLVLSQFHAVFLLNGIYTEALAYCGLLLVVASTINLVRKRNAIFNVSLFVCGFAIAAFSRFAFAIFGLFLPACLILNAALGGAKPRQAIIASALAGAIVAVGINLPSINKPFCVAAGNQYCSSTAGKMMLEFIAYLTIPLSDAERREIIEKVDEEDADDLMARAIIRAAPLGGGWGGIVGNTYGIMTDLALAEDRDVAPSPVAFTSEMNEAAHKVVRILRNDFPSYYFDVVSKNFGAFVNPTGDWGFSGFDSLVHISRSSIPLYRRTFDETMGEMFAEAEGLEQEYADFLSASWTRAASAVSRRAIAAALFGVTLVCAAAACLRYRAFRQESAVLLGGGTVFLGHAAAMSFVASSPAPRYVDAGFFLLVLCAAATAHVVPGVLEVARRASGVAGRRTTDQPPRA